MGSTQNVNVLIYGLGAIGGSYAYFFSKSPTVILSVIARSNYEAVKSKGMTMRSMISGTHTFKADNVFRTTAEASQTAKYDYVVCANKALDLKAAAEDLKPVVSPMTCIVVTQNGVGNEDAFRDRYPNNSIISCAIWIGADQTAPGEFRTRNREHTDLGLFPNPSLAPSDEQRTVETYASLLAAGSHSLSLEPNVQIKKWEKLVCNILWNPTSVLTRQLMGPSFLDPRTSPEAEAFARELMRDVVRVGRACGVPLEEEGLVDRYVKFTRSIGDFRPSMLYDFENGVPLEVDVIVGAPMRRARELGVEVPTLRAVYVLVSAVSGGMGAGPKV